MGNCCVRGTIIINNKKENSKLITKGNNQSQLKGGLTKKNTLRSKRCSVYQVNNEDIFSIYQFSKNLIGSGYFGSVRLISPKDEPDQIFAVKSIDKSKLNDKKLANLSREIEVLGTLDHPNIIKYYETYNDEKHFHIVTEYCDGGELYDRLSKKGRYSELEACTVIYKIASAISYCHSSNIVHRDLKPENILYESLEEDSDIKIIDFGLSRTFSKDELHSVVGSPYYVAPEVLDGNYDYKCDIWGIGVVMFVLLSGHPPFQDDNKPELFKKIKNDPVIFEQNIWSSVSSEAQSLIFSLLNKNPKERPKASEILEYPWFIKTMINDISPVLDAGMFKSLKNFKQPRYLVKSILKILAFKLNVKDMKQLKEKFMILDTKKTGLIDLEHIQDKMPLLNKSELNTFSPQEVPNSQKARKLDYSSFIASALRYKNLLNQETLKETFNHFNVDKTGLLNVKNFDLFFKRMGKKKSVEEIKEYMREVGYDENANIDFKEFCRFLNEYL